MFGKKKKDETAIIENKKVQEMLEHISSARTTLELVNIDPKRTTKAEMSNAIAEALLYLDKATCAVAVD